MAKRKRSGKSAAAAPEVQERIDDLADELVEFLCEFCAIETVNPPGRNYEQCVSFLRGKMDDLGMSTRVVAPSMKKQLQLAPGTEGYPRPSIIGLWDVGAKRTIHFSGHYDVVPVTSGWKTDPFDAVIRGNRLYARGSSDMKGPDAAAIHMVQAFQAAGVTPPWNIELSFTPDEETGGFAGLGHVVKSKAIRPDLAVLLEGGSGRNVGYAHRGALWADVTVLGKPGHGSNPKNGINAMLKAMGLVAELQKLAKVYANRKTEWKTHKPSQKHPTIMIGGVSGGGDKVNTIPDRFGFSIDRRLNPEEKVSDVKAEILGVIRKAQKRDKQLSVQVDFPVYVEAGTTPEDAPITRIACDAVKAVTGKNGLVRMSMGFTDMHWLTNDGKVPTIGYGTGGGGAHSDEEYVEIPGLTRAAKVYAEIVMRAAQAV